MTDIEFFEKVSNGFYELLKKRNPDLYEKLGSQQIMLLPGANGISPLHALKDVYPDEVEFINSLLIEVSKTIIR